MAKTDITGYDLSRNWFDWCFENPDLISPTHTAMYFFIIEHCNRLGWKEKFGLPMEMTKDAIGIKNYRTYSKTLTDLIDWGFIKLIQKSKNQYSSCIIAIVSNTKAHTKALDKALQKHNQKQCIDIVCIDKQELLTIEPINKEQVDTQTPFDIYNAWLKSTYPSVASLKTQMTSEQFDFIINTFGKDKFVNILMQMENKADLTRKYKSVYLTAYNWLKNAK